MRTFVQMSTILPEKKTDNIAIQHFSFTPKELEHTIMMTLMGTGAKYSCVHHLKSDYTYTKLVMGHSTWMSDTPMERITNQEFINKATGRVLMFGLGIGMCLYPLMIDDTIESITVVDINQDLINLVSPYYPHPKVRIICADAFELDLGKEKFDTIYFDIWRDMSSDNYEEMKVLHKRYRKNYNTKHPQRFIDSWMRSEMKNEYNNEKRSIW